MAEQPVGIGIDLVELDRFEFSFSRKGFREKVFTKTEIADCEAKPDPLQSYAARFAIKEAFFKALAAPLMKAVPWQEIETILTTSIPSLKLTGKSKSLMGERSAFISLTHTKHTAAAVVLIMPERSNILSEGPSQG